MGIQIDTDAMENAEECHDSGIEHPMELGILNEDLVDDLEDLPTSLIVSNMEPGVFGNMQLRVGYCIENTFGRKCLMYIYIDISMYDPMISTDFTSVYIDI